MNTTHGLRCTEWPFTPADRIGHRRCCPGHASRWVPGRRDIRTSDAQRSQSADCAKLGCRDQSGVYRALGIDCPILCASLATYGAQQTIAHGHPAVQPPQASSSERPSHDRIPGAAASPGRGVIAKHATAHKAGWTYARSPALQALRSVRFQQQCLIYATEPTPARSDSYPKDELFGGSLRLSPVSYSPDFRVTQAAGPLAHLVIDQSVDGHISQTGQWVTGLTANSKSRRSPARVDSSSGRTGYRSAGTVVGRLGGLGSGDWDSARSRAGATSLPPHPKFSCFRVIRP